MKKQKNGITLIALVITIIVLLILAGTAVSIGLNEDNLFQITDTAKQKNNSKSLMESAASAVLLCKYYETDGTFKDKLENQMPGATVTEVEGKEDVVFVEKNDAKITVYENGDILNGDTTFWDGSTIECPVFKTENGVLNWYISTPGQLKFLADFVNNGNSLTASANGAELSGLVPTGVQVTMTPETTIYLMNNLDMGARPGEGETEADKWASNTNWTPIGISRGKRSK